MIICPFHLPNSGFFFLRKGLFFFLRAIKHSCHGKGRSQAASGIKVVEIENCLLRATS